jgi:mono/diheme cytochrome c family protein
MSKTVIFRILALLMLALCGGLSFAAEGEQDQRILFREGARLWPVYCAQCHNARPGSEFSPAQWDAIMMHMRTQANLPAEEARAILVYLKSSR